MASTGSDKPMDLGVYENQTGKSGLSPAEGIAVAISVIWLVGAGAFFLFVDTAGGFEDQGTFLMTFLAIFMPLALVWVAASVARATRQMREETERLREAVSALRHSYVEETRRNGMPVSAPSEELLAEPAETPADAPATEPDPEPEAPAAEAPAEDLEEEVFISPLDVEPVIPEHEPEVELVQAPLEPEEDLSLDLEEEEQVSSISTDDFIRATNFPVTADDEEGFRALRVALRDGRTSQLIQSAQDVLTLLSNDGIYMDDLAPMPVPPELWRAFARGVRGEMVAGMARIESQEALDSVATRMREDQVFRDAAHHFLRRFDKSLVAFEPTADESDLARFGETRSARAFLLIGQATGAFG